MKMQKRWQLWVGLLGLGIGLMGHENAFASSASGCFDLSESVSNPSKPGPDTNSNEDGESNTEAPIPGPEIPTPFQVEELEDGGVYQFQGDVVWPYLKIKSRGKFKYYLLQGSRGLWEGWSQSGKAMSYVCRVHKTHFFQDGMDVEAVGLELVSLVEILDTVP